MRIRITGAMIPDSIVTLSDDWDIDDLEPDTEGVLSRIPTRTASELLPVWQDSGEPEQMRAYTEPDEYTYTLAWVHESRIALFTWSDDEGRVWIDTFPGGMRAEVIP